MVGTEQGSVTCAKDHNEEEMRVRQRIVESGAQKNSFAGQAREVACGRRRDLNVSSESTEDTKESVPGKAEA